MEISIITLTEMGNWHGTDRRRSPSDRPDNTNYIGSSNFTDSHYLFKLRQERLRESEDYMMLYKKIIGIISLLAFAIGCDSMYTEERANVEQQMRYRLSGQSFPGYRGDFSSSRAHGFGRSGAPRTVKHDYCYVDVKLIGDSGHIETHRFKVIYLFCTIL